MRADEVVEYVQRRVRMEWPAGVDPSMKVRAAVPETGEVLEGGAINVVRQALAALQAGHTLHLERLPAVVKATCSRCGAPVQLGSRPTRWNNRGTNAKHRCPATYADVAGLPGDAVGL